jgi:hypothetical protein
MASHGFSLGVLHVRVVSHGFSLGFLIITLKGPNVYAAFLELQPFRQGVRPDRALFTPGAAHGWLHSWSCFGVLSCG